jgi:heterodisulfide reductase subunit A2
MAVLSVGLEAPADSQVLAEKFGIELDQHHFAKTDVFAPVCSSREGVLVTGAFTGPKAIPRSVTEASAAASAAARLLSAAKGTLTRSKTYPPEKTLATAAPRVGVFVCACGINIAGVVDVTAVADYARTLPNVAYVGNNLFTCSADTQDLIAQKIREHDLNRIVIAACTPRTHEPLFQDTLREAG